MSEPSAPTPPADGPSRRGFFKRGLAIAIGAVVAIVPLIPGVAFFLDPIVRRKTRPSERPPTGEEGFVKVCNLAALPDDGTPQKFIVYDDKQDAWNFFPEQQVGSVWLRKKPDGGVQCFNTRCPHLGCTVDYRAADRNYFCPCHTSTFDLEGQKINVIPPRGMDSLDVKVKEEVVLVRFQNFRAATPDKVPVA